MMVGSEATVRVDNSPSNLVRDDAELSTNPKLRDSCHACARSKVRCPKQKPSCSRCENRGITCQYFLTRRPGRRRETNKSQHSKNQIAVESVTNETDSLSPWQEDFGFEFNDMDFTIPMMETPFDLSPLHGGSIGQGINDAASLLVSSSWPSTGSLSSSGKSSVSIYSQDLPSGTPIATSVAFISSCSCLAIALDLLKTLSVDGLAEGGRHSLTPIILADNKQSIDSINNMMACQSCGGDSFILTIFSMIVLRILARYAVAAGTKTQEEEGNMGIKLADFIISNNDDQRRPRNHHHATSYDDRSQKRTAAKLVLGELHRVQMLANQLSSTLKRSREAVEGKKPGTALEVLTRYEDSMDCSGSPMEASFSTRTLGLVESDVRNSLRFLSADIIKRLRQQ